MGFGPRLPDSAPFTPTQRAWLDGFLAAWFSFKGETVGEPSPLDTPIRAPVGAENFPWHDPALSLQERLALAEGRPAERVLMAAMAQLDCGQCGYLCQTYAEAIARGEEKSLTRCVPGGKATSRKLDELIGLGLGSTATAPVAAVPAALPRAMPSDLPDRHFAAIFRGADCLNGPGSEKETRHVVLASQDDRTEYEVGDSLGVIARNTVELVAAIIERLGAKPETPVLSPDGVERPLAEALSEACEIRRPSDQAVEVLASRALDCDESVVLQAMAEGYPGAGPEDADLLDLLEAFPSARPPLSELISALDPLQARLYSIASSPKHVPGEVHLAVAAVHHRRARRRLGVASTFLADRSATCEKLRPAGRPLARRHHLVSPGDIISESAGDFVGICTSAPRTRFPPISSPTKPRAMRFEKSSTRFGGTAKAPVFAAAQSRSRSSSPTSSRSREAARVSCRSGREANSNSLAIRCSNLSFLFLKALGSLVSPCLH